MGKRNLVVLPSTKKLHSLTIRGEKERKNGQMFKKGKTGL